MFVTSDQPRTIIVCLFIGILVGVFYEPFYLLKLFYNSRVYKSVLDALWLFSSSFIYTFISCEYSIGNLRAYMIVLTLCGAVMYLLSLHKIIAIFINRVYNKIIKVLKRLKSYYDRPKKKKGFFCRTIGYYNANNGVVYGYSVSSSRNSRKKKSHKSTR